MATLISVLIKKRYEVDVYRRGSGGDIILFFSCCIDWTVTFIVKSFAPVLGDSHVASLLLFLALRIASPCLTTFYSRTGIRFLILCVCFLVHPEIDGSSNLAFVGLMFQRF